MVFRTCLVEISVVDAHLKLPTGLRDDNRVGQPPWVVDLLDKASLGQLFDFLMDEVLSVSRLFLGLLLDWSVIGVDLQMVVNHLPSDPRHLRHLPGKQVNISLEEGDEHEFLFAIQVPRDVGGLGSISPDLDGLHGDTLIVQGLHMGCRD
jgi:hypothetical protein